MSWTLKQAQVIADPGSGTYTSLSSNTTAGSLIVAILFTYSGGGTSISGFQDSLGNSYIQAGNVITSNFTGQIAYYCPVSKGGANQVKMTYNGTHGVLYIAEYTYTGTIVIFSAGLTTNPGGTASTPIAITAPMSGMLGVFAAADQQSNAYGTVTAGWTPQATHSTSLALCDNQSVAYGAVSVGTTGGQNGDYHTAAAVFFCPDPGVLYTDNATRADENPLSDGGAWSNTQYPMKIASNSIRSVNAQGYAFLSGTVWPRAQYSEITLGTGDSTGTSYYIIIVRGDQQSSAGVSGGGSFENSVQAYIPANALGSSGTALLRTYVQGSFSQVTNACTPRAGDVWRLSAYGNAFLLTQNGVLILSTFGQTNYAYEGIPGCGVYDSGGSGFVSITKWTGGGFADPTVRVGMASDTFQRANGGMGAAWTQLVVATPPQIASDVVVSNGGGAGIAIYNQVTLPANHWAQATMPTIAATATNVAGPVVHGNTPGSDNDYALFVYNGSLYIQKRLNGAYSANVNNASWSSVAFDRYRLEISGTTLTAFANNILVMTGTDAGIVSGSPGLEQASASNTSPTLAPWSAGIYAALAGNQLSQLGVGT